MKPGFRTSTFLITALFFSVAIPGFSLHTDPASSEVGDTGSIAIPYASMEGGVSPIEGVRLEIANVPAWIDIDTVTSFIGPTTIYPGESMTFNVAYKINPAYDPATPAGAIIVNLLSDTTSFVPSGITWSFTSDNGFKTMHGECVDNEGIPCGKYVSPDMLAPITYLQFDGPLFETEAGKIFLSTNTLVSFVGADAYESNADISRVAVTGYSVGTAPGTFDGLNFTTIPAQLGAGAASLHFASRDNVGNTAVIKSTVVYVDALSPAADYELVGSGSVGSDGTVIVGTAAAIKLLGQDSGTGDSVSGPNRVMYSLDVSYSSDTALYYTDPLTFSPGAHTLYFTAFDNVENQSELRRLDIVVGNANIACGGTITEDTILAADLDCSAITGVAVTLGANNITIDGAGHKIIAPNAVAAVAAAYKQNIVIRNLDVSGNGKGAGVQTYYLSNSTITTIIAHNRDIGLNIDRGEGNTITGNDISGNRISLQVGGSSHTVTNNNLTSSITGLYGSGVFYLKLDASNNFAGSTTAISLAYSGEISLENLSLDNTVAIGASYTNNLTLKNLNLSGKGVGNGFAAYYLSNSLVENITAHKRNTAINISRGGGNVVRNNNLSDNKVGLQIGGSTCTVTDNNLTNNETSLYGEGADNIILGASNDFSGSTTAISLAFCRDISLANLVLSNSIAIGASYTSNLSLSNLDLSGNGTGVGVQGYYLSNSKIENVTAHMRDIAVNIDRSDNNLISSNDLSGSKIALQIAGSTIDVRENNLGGSTIGLNSIGAYNVSVGSNDFSGAVTGIKFSGGGNSEFRAIKLPNTIGIVISGGHNILLENLDMSLPSGVRTGVGAQISGAENTRVVGALVGNRDVGIKVEGACLGTELVNASIVSNNTGLTIAPPCAGVTVTNTILWGNTKDIVDAGQISVSNSDIEETLMPGVGNISVDPLFVAAALGDFRLQAESPCIDGGTNMAVVPSYDLAGEQRTQDGNDDGVGIVDIGAYERGPVPMMATGIALSTGVPASVVTISGTGFGVYSPDTSRVYVGTVPAHIDAWNTSLISFTVPTLLLPATYPVIVERNRAGITVRSFPISFTVAPSVSISSDNLVSITAPGAEMAVSAISTAAFSSTAPVFAVMRGFEPMMGSFYEFSPSGVQFITPATLSFRFDPVGVDTNTVAIYYYSGVDWSSASIYNQRITYGSDGMALLEGEIYHTSLYAVLHVKNSPVAVLNLDPDTLNLKSKGEALTATLRMLPGAYGCFSRASIKISAVNGQPLLPPVPAYAPHGYEVECGSTTVKFNREALAAVLPSNAQVKVTVSGLLADNRNFSAEDTIRTIKPVHVSNAWNLSVSAAAEFKLGEVYVSPDPAKGGSVPVFHIEAGVADSVRLSVFTMAGQLAHEVVLNGAPLFIGSVFAYEYAWKGRIADGNYYYTVEAERSGRRLTAKGKFSVMR